MRRPIQHIERQTAELIDQCLRAWRQHARVRQLRDSEMRRLLETINTFHSSIGADATRLIDAFEFADRLVTGALAVFTHTYEDTMPRKYHPEARFGHAVHALAVIDICRDLGRVLIRPETFGDKALELFSRREIDFDDHPSFSSRYYVLATDEALLRQHANREFLDAVASRRDLVVEINGAVLAATVQQPMDATNAAALLRLVVRMHHAWS